MADLLEQLKAALADRYRIERELGLGGMATVYLARPLLVGLLIGASGCFLGPDSTGLWSDVDIAEYDRLPIIPSDEPHPYWDAFVASDEYSYSEMAVDDRIIAADGQVCTVSPCADDYQSYRTMQNGLWMLCPPLGCWLYLARIRNDTLLLQTRGHDWVELFAPYNSREKVAAVVRRTGYHWLSDDSTTGLIKDLGDAYELIVLRGITCGGDVRRYQIVVDAFGTIDTLRSKLYEQGDSNCNI